MADHARVLIVDDDPANLLAMQVTLAPLGEELVTARSGEEALRKVLELPDFAVVLLDVRMPGLSGYETARVIKTRDKTRHLPIIFLTAYGRDEQPFKGYEHGAVDYMHKPIDPDVLRCKVAVFVDLWRKGETIRRQHVELRFRNLTNLMPLCLWVASPDGKLTHCNQVWTAFSGLGTEDATIDEMPGVHPDDRDRLRAAWRRAGAKRGFELEYRLRRADGAYLWHLGRAVPDLDETGRVAEWIVTAVDIDSQKQVEASNVQLLLREREARADAEAANRAKDDFLAMISHELRTPLNAIIGWTELLRSRSLEAPAVSQALEAVDRSARVQRQLIEDILDLSRIVAGKLRLEPHDTDLAAVAKAAVDGLRPSAESRGITLEYRGAERVGPFPGDAERLQQAVWNVLTNALKFTSRGGHVWVEVSDEAGVGRISVRDDGIGIASEFLPHVFERFRQADSSSARLHGGLGLGLTIARHLIELHQGSIRAESTGPGQGSTFTITIPWNALLATRSAPPVSITPSSPAPLRGLRVLLVDDSEDMRLLFSTILARHGAEPVLAANADEALEALRRERLDVMLSDIGLPKEDGYTLIRRVRNELGSDVPAAALTAFARDDDRANALAAGFQLHLKKPVPQTELVSAIARLAGRIHE